MRGILEFDLDDPHDADRFDIAANAVDWALAMSWLEREALKRAGNISEETEGVLCEAWEEFQNLIRVAQEKYNVNTDDIP